MDGYERGKNAPSTKAKPREVTHLRTLGGPNIRTQGPWLDDQKAAKGGRPRFGCSLRPTECGSQCGPWSSKDTDPPYGRGSICPWTPVSGRGLGGTYSRARSWSTARCTADGNVTTSAPGRPRGGHRKITGKKVTGNATPSTCIPVGGVKVK